MKKSIIAALSLFSICAASPAIAHDTNWQDTKFKMMDSNSDGVISNVEHAAFAESMFVKFDANRDGRLTKDEMMAMMKHHDDTHKSKGDMSKDGGVHNETIDK